MSRPARAAAVIGGVLALAIAGFLLLRPAGDEETSAGTASTPAVTATAPSTVTATTAEPAPKPKPKPKVPVITVRGGQPVGGVKEIEVDKGETIRFKVRSDAPDEVHVHGFDVEQQAAPGAPASFRIEADIEGRFEVESHTTGTQLARITVNP
jgi:heme/copper-type cytochrome/quinol oxidase subunit 2